jgi:uncharacterized protein (TIGR02611 family)
VNNFEIEPTRAQSDREKYLRPEWLERLRLKIARNKALELVYRLVVLAIGSIILLAGVAMLVFPGPGWAAIVLGLLILATEFRWAEILLEPLQRLINKLASRAKDPQARGENIVFVLVAVIAMALALWWYLARYGVTLEPLPFIN